MDMNGIPSGYAGEIDLHHLQVLDVLLREHSLTRAARLLNVTQPALSKTLARLRRYFGDPLFVRVSLRSVRICSMIAWIAGCSANAFGVGSMRSETRTNSGSPK